MSDQMRAVWMDENTKWNPDGTVFVRESPAEMWRPCPCPYCEQKRAMLAQPNTDWFPRTSLGTVQLKTLDVDAERTRILSWLDSMEPSREPYSRPSSEFERKIARRLWERMREAIEGGKEAPKGEK